VLGYLDLLTVRDRLDTRRLRGRRRRYLPHRRSRRGTGRSSCGRGSAPTACRSEDEDKAGDRASQQTGIHRALSIQNAQLRMVRREAQR
jgi:hypothetical protein